MSLIEAMDSIGSQIPIWAVAAFFTILGAIWGSFVAALCQRWPKGESVVSGRSHCDHCGATLGAAELVPIVSFLLQKGRCRRCGASIAPINFWIELGCAALGLICALLFSGWALIGAAVFCWLLIPLIRLDWQHLWLPDRLILLLALAGALIGGLVFEELTLMDQLLCGIAGFGALELIRRSYSWLRGIEAMGGGDPKLFGAIGLWTGWQALPILLLMASVIGLIHFAARPGTWREASNLRLPLGSYIGLGALLWLFILSRSALNP